MKKLPFSVDRQGSDCDMDTEQTARSFGGKGMGFLPPYPWG